MSKKLKLVDIINLNSKASCLSTSRWQKALQGGQNSELFKILKTYVELNSKVTLGIIGSTLADIAAFNPKVIQLIAEHPQNFELIYRPYVHSLSIFWSDKVFKKNVEFGKLIIDKYFNNVYPAYLPPEFVLRNSQLVRLKKSGIKTTFIHPNRVKSDFKEKLPRSSFTIRTIQEQDINCIPFNDKYDKYYLDTIQMMQHAEPFRPEGDTIIGWRDGESPFFLPDSVEREQHFIKESNKQFQRVFLSEIKEPLDKETIKSYPQNSLLPWFSNFRLLWYINELKMLESSHQNMSEVKHALFYLLLNSDVLSSTEKNNIKVRLNSLRDSGNIKRFTIRRQSRNLEAEEILYLIENCDDHEILEYLNQGKSGFLKLIAVEMKQILELSK